MNLNLRELVALRISSLTKDRTLICSIVSRTTVVSTLMNPCPSVSADVISVTCDSDCTRVRFKQSTPLL